MNTKLKYLIVEDSPKVCEGILERMNDYEQWNACSFAHHVEEAKKIASCEKPQLIFLDWALKGGSAFEVLKHIQTIPEYEPYIIFNTGYQSENPEIPQDIINNFKVDKYLIKPIWSNLRKNLSCYVDDAEKKFTTKITKKTIILNDINKGVHKVDLLSLVCVCQEAGNRYNKVFHFYTNDLTVKINWKQIVDLLEANHIDYFFTNARQHLIVKNYIESYSRPFVRLTNFRNKIEIVKDKLHEFEQWLRDEPAL